VLQKGAQLADHERYSGHRVHTALTGLREKLNAIDGAGWEEPGTTLLAGSRLIAERTQRLLDVQEQELVPRQLLESMARGVDQASARIDVGAAEADMPSIHDAFTELVSAAASLPQQLPVPADKVGARLNGATLRARVEAETAIRKQAETAKADIEDTAVAATRASSDAKDAATLARDEVRAARDQAIGASQAATTSMETTKQAVESRLASLEGAASTLVRNADTAINGIEERFQTAEGTRASTFDEMLKEKRAEQEADLDSARARNGEVLRSVEATAKRAEEVLQLAGATTLAGRWIGQARGNLIERICWLVALATFVSGSLFFSYHFRHELTAPPDADWLEALAFYFPRLPLAIVSIVIVGFMVQQASRRATWEARDRRVANELTALPALIDRLEPNVQKELVAEIAKRYLPGTDLSHDQPASQQRETRPSPPSAWTGGLYALIGSVSTAVVLAAALIVAVSR